MESLYRWTRRNPGVAAMTTVTLSVLLLTLALTLRSNLAFQKQNDRLGYLNEQLTAEQLRTQELNTQADESRQRAETGEQRFQKLAWNAGIRQAYSAWEHHEIPETLHLLDELKTTDTEAESRIEWQMLHQEVVNFRQPLLKLDEPIYELRQIPDSSLIVAAAGNGNIYISNAVTGELVRTIRTAAKSLHALAISPDGNFLATGGVTERTRIFRTRRSTQSQRGNSSANCPGSRQPSNLLNSLPMETGWPAVPVTKHSNSSISSHWRHLKCQRAAGNFGSRDSRSINTY